MPVRLRAWYFPTLPTIAAAHGLPIDFDITIDEGLTFKKLKLKLGFSFCHKSSFSFNSRKRLLSAAFLVVTPYRLRWHCVWERLCRLFTLAGCCLPWSPEIHHRWSLTHRCILYALDNWLPLLLHRLLHWYIGFALRLWLCSAVYWAW